MPQPRTLRQRLISKPLMKLFSKVLPPMSQTERDAIEAGTTWWEAELFQGRPDWNKLHAYPIPQLTEREQAFIDGPTETLCRMINDWEVTHESADLSPEIWQYLKEQGFFAMIIKREYGGLDFSAFAQSRVLQKVAGVSGVLGSTVAVPNSLGPGELLQHYGTEEQRNYYLPRLAKGDEIPCFALTSPEAGSDAGSIPDAGVVCYGDWQGERTLGMRLTWNKRYITLAPVATVLGLAFKLSDPDHLLGDETDVGITCALIPTTTPGVEIGRRHFPLNIPFQNGPTRGKDVFVPLDYIIGGPKMAGQGWRMLVECLSVGRGISLPGNSTGGTKQVALASGAYARIRRQFKVPIGQLEGIEAPLGRIGANAYLMEAAARLTTTGIDLGEKPSVISAIVKYHMTHRGQQSIIDAMDIHGGKGICMGPNNYLGRFYQGAPIAITVEGANILTRNLIIFGQGAIRCHPYVLKEMLAVADNDLESFDKSLFGHLAYGFGNTLRSIGYGLTGARFSRAPVRDATARYYRQINRLASNLALLSDVAMATLGGSLKRRERISARLGDVLSELYLATATLKRYQDDGRPVADLPLVQKAVEDSLHKAWQAIDKLLSNYPNRALASTLRVLLYPFGRPVKAASDRLDHKIARLLQTPGETRSRIGVGMCVAEDAGLATSDLERGLRLILQAEPIWKQICQLRDKKLPFMFLDRMADAALADKLIDEAQARQLREAEIYRLKVINVDDFDSAELMANHKPQTGRQADAA